MSVVTIDNRRILFGFLIAALGFLVAFNQLSFYLSNHFLIGLALVGFAFSVNFQKGKQHYLSLIFSIIFAVLFLVFQMQFAYYFAFLFLIIAIIENFYQRVNYTSIAVLIIASPLINYINGNIGFEIRLWLSKIVAKTLNIIMPDEVTPLGNSILVNGISYTVDDACLGLNMAITTLVIICILIAYYEKKRNHTVGIAYLLLTLVITYILVLLSNFMRIIMLILFNSPPETISHETIGIASMLIYSVLPMIFYVRKTLYPRKPKPNRNLIRLPRWAVIFIMIIVIGILSVPNYSNNDFRVPDKDEHIKVMEMDGFRKEILNNNIVKFSNQEALIYIKPATKLYHGDHSPMICWRGEGLHLKEERKESFRESLINRALLIDDTTMLHTAWWYQSKSVIEDSPFSWRFRSVKKGQKFRLINVTSGSVQQLEEAIQNCMRKMEAVE